MANRQCLAAELLADTIFSVYCRKLRTSNVNSNERPALLDSNAKDVTVANYTQLLNIANEMAPTMKNDTGRPELAQVRVFCTCFVRII